jgi:hypothetical protein
MSSDQYYYRVRLNTNRSFFFFEVTTKVLLSQNKKVKQDRRK